MPDPVPLIDLARARGSAHDRRRLARQIDDANCHIGFLAVVNHGVCTQLLDDMYAVTAEFFDSDESVKLSVRAEPGTDRGYMPPKSRALARTRGQMTPADLVEFFSIGLPDVPGDDPWFGEARRRGHFHDNIWPAIPGFRAIWERYYAEMAGLAFDMMRLFALALGLDEHWFDDKVDRPISNLFANHYPPLQETPDPGQLRIGEHTDYGSLTLLYQRDVVGGLEVRLDGVWVPVAPVADSFVVNIGDLMARWTNDRWTSTLHRVQNPTLTGPASRRLSLPFFCQPNYDAVIETVPTCVSPSTPPKYPAITAGQNVTDKTDASFAVQVG
ncbi:isopenicillin N synthase family oxygenase [Mycolicibacterium sp. 018/SC-01/001]|uniref:isopenicillin N synthase family dioxygenase n=1 Tax=Mycolicibacterium sp. 018/SC-01/001 TaxID=2592069 RepID=UPI00163D74C0|nr:isopenicillin N synthase family oxygenase [Mycolicibacterium sp. 018/SC-01/001]